MASIAEIVHSRGVANDRAAIAQNRNHALRSSSTGRLLLVLERCLELVDRESGTNRRRWSRLMDDLSYACEIADEAGVPNGYVDQGPKRFSLVFALSAGDVVFTNLKDSLGADAFSGQPIASNNSFVLAHAIAEVMSQQSNSALRRSTRIPADVPVAVERDGFAFTGETVSVNLHGALVKLRGGHLKRGDRVTVKVQPTGKSAIGAVVFANEASHQFGIELQHPENIWGVIPQPPDWNKALA